MRGFLAVLVCLLAVLACLSCVHQARELSAADHRAEAAQHLARSRAERGAATPAAGAAGAAGGYAPAPQRVEAADREMRAAVEHLLAAQRLESFEDARCHAIAPAQRSACPLLASAVTRVLETPAGVLLELRDGVDAVDTFRRLDCHLAYAIAQGFDRPSCPLFVKGMEISLVMGSGPHAIRMTSEDGAVAEQLQQQARRIFGAATPLTAR
ncbi:MAG: hypothetical protein IPJ65_15015 [Archangiaceae bacterium]|nr:hypothetical protein [Archangiaceae bacterium]